MTEMELKVDGGRIVSAELKDGVLKILVEGAEKNTMQKSEVQMGNGTHKKREGTGEVHKRVDEKKESSAQFVLVPASSLSLADEFMKYEPDIPKAKKFKDELTYVIKEGVPDFYRPNMDPSIDSQGKICYQAGLNPALDKSYLWWKKNAREFCPERKSRLGIYEEYVAFLGDLIKKLVESGWNIADAWYAVCVDSKDIVSHRDCDAKSRYAPTGSVEICGYFDLGNTLKYVAGGERTVINAVNMSKSVYEADFYTASCGTSWRASIADIYSRGSTNPVCWHEVWFAVGWLVLEK